MPTVQLTEDQILVLLNLIQKNGEFLASLKEPSQAVEGKIEELKVLRRLLAQALAGKE